MRSEAQKRADKKYKAAGKDAYTTLSVSMHSDSVKVVKGVASSQNLTPSKYAARAISYCVNNEVDLSEYDEKLRSSDDDETKK